MSAVFLGGMLIFFAYAWLPRLDLDTSRAIKALLTSPIAWAHPLMISAVFLAIGQGLDENWRRLLGTPYRASLIAVSLGGILFLGLFSYNPVRYYVPLLPVFVLLLIDWLQMDPTSSDPSTHSNTLTKIASRCMMFVALLSMVLAANRLVLGWFDPEQGADPSYVAPIRFTHAFIIAAILVLLLSVTPAMRLLLQKKTANRAVLLLLLLSLVVNLVAVSRVLTRPGWERARIAREVEELLPPGASIGGDWAPLFAIGTELRALYMNQTFNAPERVKLVRPDFLVLSDTPGMRAYWRALEDDPEVGRGPAIYESHYHSRRVSIHPLKYDQDSQALP